MPREKALEYGIGSLNNVELLALVLKSAYKDSNVYELAESVIDTANGFDNILSLTYEELTSIKGIKKAKAMEIMAILEISKRLSHMNTISEPEIKNPKELIDYLRFNLAFSQQEEFFVIFLNGRGNVIKAESMFKGNCRSAIVGIDQIIRSAILLKARGIIVAHNHPSNNASPSSEDIELTNQLNRACKMMNITLHDHIIICKSEHFSFQSHSMLK